MGGIRVGFQTTDGQSLWISFFFFLGGGGVNFHENVRRELLNDNQICPSLYKILFSKGTHFYTHELSHFISENVSKHQIQ